MRREAHTLKSSIAILGAGETAALAEELELAGKAENLEAVGRLHDELKRQIDALMRSLERNERV